MDNHRYLEMHYKETSSLKLVPEYNIVMELAERKEEMKGVQKRMKEFIGEKKMDDLNLRELIEFEKKLESLELEKNVDKIPVEDMNEEIQDIIIMKSYVYHKIQDMEDKILKTQDEFDIIMEAFEDKEGPVKGLKMRMKVCIEDKELEDLLMEDLIEFNKKLEALQPKSVEEMHMKDMTEEIKDIIVMKEILKKMIAKRKPSSSDTMIISDYYV